MQSFDLQKQALLDLKALQGKQESRVKLAPPGKKAVPVSTAPQEMMVMWEIMAKMVLMEM